MSAEPTFHTNDYLLLHRKLYDLFRQKWSVQKTDSLKKRLKDSLQKTADESSESVLNNLMFDMKTALILIDEIGL